uniref:Zgc:158640 n=1 Tax=Eptatretus burgeri TaxID=7764 RepID=A0A8C4N299_EPTBU
MLDLLKEGSGGIISLATSNDARFPAENILDGQLDTFWMTTGMFPQEFVVSLVRPARLHTIRIHTHGVKHLSMEWSSAKEPVDFKHLAEKELEPMETLQVEEFSAEGLLALHLRFIILNGHDHFVSVHQVTLEGE